MEIKKAMCDWCKAGCGVLAYVDKGRLVKVEQDPDFPPAYPPIKGCAKIRAAIEHTYHPARIQCPLRRVGERGEGKWQTVAWEQALDDIAERLRKLKDMYGAECVGTTSGTRGAEREYRGRFFNLFGSPNHVGSTQICFGPRSVAATAFAGMFPNYSVEPVTKLIVMLGIEPLVARPFHYRIIREAIANGAKTIVIDPRRTYSASRSDIWLQLRPGTDAALLLAMANVIIKENLYDKEFVEKWCYGFDELKEHLKSYSPGAASGITSVPVDKIVEAARLYATTKPGCFLEGMGIEQQQNNTSILHARWILAAMAGNIDVEGGEELTGPHPQFITSREIEMPEKLSPEQRRKQLGYDRFKLYSWMGRELIEENVKKAWGKPGGSPFYQAMAHAPTLYRAAVTGKPYPIKALITANSNPLITHANTKLVYKALKNLWFYVVLDSWMTPCAELADYVLPEASWLERPSFSSFVDYSPYMLGGEAALPTEVEGQFSRKTQYDFFRGLGIRLGQGEYWPWKTLEESLDYRVRPLGYSSFKDFIDKGRIFIYKPGFRKYEKTGFGTPTGKVELYSTVLEKLGYDPLPSHVEPPETVVSNPELANEYPLTLITGGKIREFFHSEWRQIESVRNHHPEPLVQIHSETASELGIREGDWVWIETLRGKVRQKAKLFDGMDKNVVHAEHGWWFPELPGEEPWLHGLWESNINVLMTDELDYCSSALGSWPLRTALCKVYRAKTFGKAERKVK